MGLVQRDTLEDDHQYPESHQKKKRVKGGSRKFRAMEAKVSEGTSSRKIPAATARLISISTTFRCCDRSGKERDTGKKRMGAEDR
jgi:hypothetical protein